MKITIDQNANRTVFSNDDGEPYKHLHVSDLNIVVKPNDVARAYLEIQIIKIDAGLKPEYIVGGKRAIGIILEDGTLDYFPEVERP